MSSRVTADRIPSGERPRSLGLPRYLDDGRALNEAMELTGVSAKEIAAAWKTDAETVHEVRRGAKPLSWQRVQRLPPAVRLALLNVEVMRAKQDAALPSDLVLTARIVENRAAVAFTAAIADGRIEAAETPAIKAAVVADRADLDAIEARACEVDRDRVSGVRVL